MLLFDQILYSSDVFPYQTIPIGIAMADPQNKRNFTRSPNLLLNLKGTV